MNNGTYKFSLSDVQVEVQINYLNETPKEDILAQFTIEATLFDTGSWYCSNDNAHIDLLSSSVSHLQLDSSQNHYLGFVGYMLKGKLQMPKLWSAEQVRQF